MDILICIIILLGLLILWLTERSARKDREAHYRWAKARVEENFKKHVKEYCSMERKRNEKN